MFFSIASQLTTLIQNKVTFVWPEACKNNFYELKDGLTSTPMLTLLQGSDGLVVYFDISRICLGCVLMKNGKVISCYPNNLRHMKGTILPMISN